MLNLFKPQGMTPNFISKQFLPVIFLLLVSNTVLAQINNNGCLTGDFGIDAGLYSGLIEFGQATPAAGSNDWFQGPSGLGFIDESNSASIENLLKTQFNPTYERRLAFENQSIIDGKIIIDGLFARDHFGGTGATDLTSYTSAAKNGQDPAIWPTGPSNVLGKNDLVDVAGMMFRTGTQYANSELWFTGIINRAEPGGTAYIDFEYMIREVTYDPSTGFSSAGPDLGHTAYTFEPDPANPGKHRINGLGDFIFNVSLTGGGSVVNVETRLWVSRNDYLNLLPSTFNWGSEFDGAFNGAPFGYASIVPLTTDICGKVNEAGEIPAAPPWGTKNTKTNVWGTSYQEFSVAEVGINLTALGIDNILLEAADPCFFPINTFIIKSRASASFTAQLKDFAGPFFWGQPQGAVAVIGSNFLSCDNPTTQVEALPSRDDASYLWQTIGGNIISDPTQRVITVDQPGKYFVEITLPTNCPFLTSEIEIGIDPTKPFFIEPTTIQATTACNNNDGTITVSTQGGTPPYSFTVTKDGNPFTTINGNNTGVFSLTGLEPGLYEATIKGLYACQIFTGPITIPARVPLTINETITNVDCFGNRTGAINVEITGGNGPFTYQWSSGNLTQDINNLRAGNYTLNVTDADGCITTEVFAVTQPARLSASVVKIDDADPDLNVGDGTITVTPSGGTAPFTYAWTGPDGFTANTATIQDLKYGSYTVAITDSLGCTFSTSVFIFEPEICDDAIDNDGDGLTDCEDPDCTPATTSAITPGKVLPCVGEQVTYTIINDPAVNEYVWTVPANASISSGQGTNQITVVWSNINGGAVCVRAKVFECLSPPVCYNAEVDDVPVQPEGIDISNN
jgi:hypothetical protein